MRWTRWMREGMRRTWDEMDRVEEGGDGGNLG
jgi:hypothetical protein